MNYINILQMHYFFVFCTYLTSLYTLQCQCIKNDRCSFIKTGKQFIDLKLQA